MLIQVFISVRSERQLVEQIRYNLLYRWFIGLAIDDEVWDHSSFSKNRDRLLEHRVVENFFTEVMTLADKRKLLSKDHFSVDGTLIQAWVSHKSFTPKDRGQAKNNDSDSNPGAGARRNAAADWHGKPRSNATHASTTDPDSRLFRKSQNAAAILAYQGHVLMEHRSGLVVGADGYGERSAALAMLYSLPGKRARTVAADRAYDTRDFVPVCRQRHVTPHVASHSARWGCRAIDGRTTQHEGYAISQTIRKRIEEYFSWGKTVGRIRQTVYRVIERVDQHFKLTMTASNIVRMARMFSAMGYR